MVAFTFALLSLIKAGETKGRSFSHLSDAVSKLEHSVRVLGLTLVEESEEKKYRPFALNPPPKTVEEAKDRFGRLAYQIRNLEEAYGEASLVCKVKEFEQTSRNRYDEREKRQDSVPDQLLGAARLSYERFLDGVSKPWKLMRRIDSDLSADVLEDLAGKLGDIEAGLDGLEEKRSNPQGRDGGADPSRPRQLGLDELTPAQQLLALAGEIDLLVSVIRAKHPGTPTGPEKTIERRESRVILYPVDSGGGASGWAPVVAGLPEIRVERDGGFTHQMAYHCFFKPGSGDRAPAVGTQLGEHDRANLERLYRSLRLQGRGDKKVELELTGFASSVPINGAESEFDSRRQNLLIAVRRENAAYEFLMELHRQLDDGGRVTIVPPENWGVRSLVDGRGKWRDGLGPVGVATIRRACDRMEDQRNNTFVGGAALAEIGKTRSLTQDEINRATMIGRRVDVRVTSFGMAQPPRPGPQQPAGVRHVHDASIPRAIPVDRDRAELEVATASPPPAPGTPSR